MQYIKKSRDERQEEARVKWIKNKCKGVIEAATGFGKTRIALNCIKTLLSRYPNKQILIVVPTTGLQEQWLNHLDAWGFQLNCDVQIINTVIKQQWTCDLLVLDEIHRFFADQMRQVFECVHYKLILGLTATIERLDGKHTLINKYCPIVDRITLVECQINEWVSTFKEYEVILDVDDIDVYKGYNRDFVKYFEFFNFDWNLVTSCLGKAGFINRAKLRDRMCPKGSEEEKKRIFQQITINSIGFMRVVQKRKAFINNHPKKLEIARKIIEARPNSKIITFSNNIKMAESIGMGFVYTGKDSKKKGRITIEEFSKLSSGVLNTSQKANEGLDIPGLSVAIMLGIDSSKIKAVQRLGRVVRVEEGKEAEIFNLVIADTVELEWYRKSHPDNNYTIIDEKGLDAVLRGENPIQYKRKLTNFTFRY